MILGLVLFCYMLVFFYVIFFFNVILILVRFKVNVYIIRFLFLEECLLGIYYVFSIVLVLEIDW